MSRFIVTGATGLIGRRMVDRLVADDHDVTAMIHVGHEPNPFGDQVRVVAGDVTEADSLAGKFDGFDHVIHLAGCTIAPSARDFFTVNRDGTVNVARQCVAADSAPKLMYVSSLAASGPSPDGRPKVETDDASPVSNYGRSKLEAETALRELAGQVDVQIVRPCSVFGDTDRFTLGLFKTARAGWVVLPGLVERLYSFIHLDDLVESMLAVAQSDEKIRPNNATSPNPDESPDTGASPDTGQWDDCLTRSASGMFNLSHDPPVTYRQFAEIVRDELGGNGIKAFPMPSPVCWTVAAANSLASKTLGVRPLLNLDKMREGMAGSWVSDSGRLTTGLGFRFECSLQERIRQTARAYRQKGWL